jgi:four helix bundle protein
VAGSYKDLRAWKQAVELVVEIYRATQTFPRSELYGLTNQMRRAAVSVPSNIAEGKGRASDREFAHFLHQTRGSLLELETQLYIATELEYLVAPQGQALSERTESLAKTLNALLKAIRGTTADEGREVEIQVVARKTRLANDQRPSASS